MNLTRLRYEFRAVGWPAFGLLLVGMAAANFFVLNAASPNVKARDLMIVLGATLGLMLTLLPTSRTDRAFELTRNAAEPDGARDVLHAMGSGLMVLLGFVLLLSLWRLPVEVLGWFPPRALWFATVGAAVLLGTRSTPLAVGAVALVFVLPYCPLPVEINPMVIKELRWQLHALTAVLGLLVPWCCAGWAPRSLGRLMVGAALAAFSMWPILIWS